MNNERRQLQMPFLCCALVLLCSCIFCWEALGRPVRVQLNNSLDIVPFLTACGFFCGCILCTLMRRASLCLRLLSACLLFGVGLTLASFTQVSPLYFCLTFCLIGGAGAGMTFCLCVLVVFCWMPARRGLGFGALCGSAFLSIALVDATVPHLFQDPSFGWHGAYLLFGLIAATALFVAAFTLRLPDNISEISGSHAMRPMELVCLVCLAAAFAAVWRTGTDYAIINSHHAGSAAALGALASGFAVQQHKTGKLLIPCAWLMTLAAVSFVVAVSSFRRDLAASFLMLCCFSGGMLSMLCLYGLGTSVARCSTAVCGASLLLIILCAAASVPQVFAISISRFVLPLGCMLGAFAAVVLTALYWPGKHTA
jgi:MFS family permease